MRQVGSDGTDDPPGLWGAIGSKASPDIQPANRSKPPMSLNFLISGWQGFFTVLDQRLFWTVETPHFGVRKLNAKEPRTFGVYGIKCPLPYDR